MLQMNISLRVGALHVMSHMVMDILKKTVFRVIRRGKMSILHQDMDVIKSMKQMALMQPVPLRMRCGKK